eukprot:m.79232 g.79232  ORF g.79232 m.79232 type:complete len:426 (+) comp19277_c0_seq1:209-1486(+)
MPGGSLPCAAGMRKAGPVVGGVRWWTRRGHGSFCLTARHVVTTILLSAQRMRDGGGGGVRLGDGGGADTPPLLPPELWIMIVSLLQVTPVRFAVETVAGTPGRSGVVNGALRTSSFFVPTGLAVNHVSGVIYVADSNNHRIRSIDCSKGSVSTVAGSAHFGFRDGPADTAEFQNPMDVALLDSGGVLVSDSENSVVRHISPDSIVTTVTGDSTGQEAMLYRPQGITVTPNGDILICDTLNHRIARLRPESGVVSTLAQAKRWEQEPQLGASFGMPTSVAQLPSGNFIVSAGATNRLWEVTSEGSITKVVGDGPGFIDDVCGHFQDGPGSTAKFWHPCGICVDGVGNVVVADTNNNCIRLVRPSQGWTCTKIAGDLRRGHRDGDAEHAQFFRPVGLTLDRDGSILVADTDNHVVRRVRATSYDFTI